MATIAVVTGASQGIGAAIAETFAGEPGIRLALVARHAKNLEKVATRCRARGAEVLVCPCDLTREAEVGAMAESVRTRLGSPDLLVNNAGSFVRADLLQMDYSEFQAVLDANLSSAFLVTRAFVGEMQARKRGTIFYIASVASLKAYPESGAYCAAKHGLLGLARAFRACTQGSGLRISTLMPGATQTPSWDSDSVPPERLMPAEDIATAVLDIYKLSDRSVVEEMILRPTLGDL
jgi:NAD(P)-dependent dehydrogenase (short-subunit alcohol dehydrogenase family)